MRCSAKVENLFDGEYLEAGLRTPGRTVAAGMAFGF
jgi:outer membrane cobalamin receptor